MVLRTWTASKAYVPELPADSLEGQFDWSLGGMALELHLVNRVAYFSDDFHRFAHTAEADQLPTVASRMELLADPAVKGGGVVTPEEDVTARWQTGRRSVAFTMSVGRTPSAWRCTS